MKIKLCGEGMKTLSVAVVYLAVCFLMFTGWMIGFAQHAPFNGQEQAFSLTYLLYLFSLYVVREPFYQFFQVTKYVKVFLDLGDDSGQLINFYNEIPVMWIYSLSAVLTFFYIIAGKLFTHKRVKR